MKTRGIDLSARVLVLGALFFWLASRLGGEAWRAGHPTTLACILGGWAVLIGGGLARWEPGWAGAARHAFLAGVATYAVWPFLDTRFSGAGDAYYYCLQIADYVSQLRAGIWPVFVGQSAYGFIGTVHPVRTAPEYTHLAGLCDGATLHSLSLLAVQKLALWVASAAGILSAYLAARRLLGAGRANGAAALAGLYLLSPGVLAPLYLSDMYPTFMTVAWLPWVVAGLIGISESPERREGWGWWGLGIGGLWWAHAPTAAWAMGLSALILAAAWRPRSLRQWGLALVGLGLAAALSGYVFVSVRGLYRFPLPGEADAVRRAIVRGFVGWRERLGPALGGEGASILYGWQIGLGVGIAALVGLYWGWRDRIVLAMAGGVAGLWVMLGVWPTVGRWLWMLTPASIVELTNKWPAQRFAGLISALAVGIATVGLRRWQAARPGRGALRLAGLALLVFWSAREAWVYERRIEAIKADPDSSSHVLDPERITFELAAAHTLGNASPYLSEGHMDPAAEYRLVDPRSGAVWADGLTLRRGAAAQVSTYELTLRSPGGNMAPAGLTVPPGGAIFTFGFQGEPRGILELKFSQFTLDYALPSETTAPAAFGSGPLSRRSILLKNPDAVARPFEILFWPGGETPQPSLPARWASLKVQPWSLDRQAVRLKRLIPAVVELEADRPGWLESPKIWIPGYTATVDGRAVAVVRSPHDVVAVPVAMGRHVVVLSYSGPATLRLAYWFSVAAWLAVVGGWAAAGASRHLGLSS